MSQMAELNARLSELLTEVFGPDHVEVEVHPMEDPPTVEFGNVWIGPPDDDWDKFTWGVIVHDPGSYHTPPETDYQDKGSSDKMDEVLKAAILFYVGSLLDEKFLSEHEDALMDEQEANDA